MARSANQKLRILYIKNMLEKHTDEAHGLSSGEIIDMLAQYNIEAERKTIYDDIEKLNDYGMDILKQNGKNGGYYVASRDFQMPELKLMVDAVQASKFITKKKSEELIKKLESLTSKYSAQSLQRQVHVINRIKYDNEAIYYNIDRVYDAISCDKMISFEYYEQVVDFSTPQKHRLTLKKQEKYEISPWALTWDDENYYLVGYDSAAEGIRHYRLDKMRDISVLAKARDGKKRFESFDLATYSKSMFGMFGGEEEQVRLRFHNKLIGVVLDRFGDKLYLSPEDSTHFNAVVTVKTSPLFYSWLFSFGNEVEIVSPKSIADEYVKRVKAVIKQYE